MYANIACPACGLQQEVPVGPMPTLGACAQCGCAINVPGASMVSQPANYPRGPMPMQQPPHMAPGYGPPRGAYGPQGYYRPPYGMAAQKSNNTALIAIISIVSVIVLIALLVGIGAAFSDAGPGDFGSQRSQVPRYSPPPIYESQEDRPAPRKWRNVPCWSGFFSANFPSEPQYKATSLETPLGKLKVETMAVFEDDADWSVEYHDVPNQDVESVDSQLDQEVSRFIAGYETSVVSKGNSFLANPHGDEFPGRTIELDLGDGDNQYIRVYLVRNRVFILSAVVYNSTRRDEVDRFLQSFKLIKKAPDNGWPASYEAPPKKEDRGTEVPKPK